MKRRPIISLIIIMFFIVLSAILFSIDDFGGVYWQNYYSGVEGWEWFYFNHLASGPFMVLVVLLFTAIFIIMAVALGSKKFGSRKTPYIASLVMLGIIFLISFIGMNVLWIAGETGDYDDWWWDTACYVGNIAPILISLMMIYPIAKVVSMNKKNKRKEGKKKKRSGEE